MRGAAAPQHVNVCIMPTELCGIVIKGVWGGVISPVIGAVGG